MSGKQARRAVGAALAISGLCAVIAVTGSATGAVEDEVRRSFSGRAYAEQLIDADGEMAGETPAAGRDVRDAPPWVEAEVADLAGVEELRATDDWSTIGFSRETDATVECEWLEDQLIRRGWTLAKTGVEGTLTGVKEEGRCSWLWFSATTVGGETCVVIQVLAR